MTAKPITSPVCRRYSPTLCSSARARPFDRFVFANNRNMHASAAQLPARIQRTDLFNIRDHPAMLEDDIDADLSHNAIPLRRIYARAKVGASLFAPANILVALTRSDMI
ncbi:hypothetical protein MES5069_620017 [Mesorhizobium escarrei]|uniref:Uncharacterized protein n=1 Tax=Mesorhizobium escarrei TaxID=666018 RepID=A0ABM9EE87_9HYPH|nr:hypothetical protein MES5069_620017 [Mesorhizobium escarrei]